MKKILLIVVLTGFTNGLFAQSKELTYKQKATEIQKQIWDTKSPEFSINQIPANLVNESAVIIARSYDMQRSSAGRIKFMIITAGSVTRAVTSTTFREKVKINDKAALEKFSTIEYKKKIDKTANYGIMKIANSLLTYIGIKIIKPDGTQQIVNPDEEVLIKNEAKDQLGKIAVPGLQVGDIIDYYISTESITEDIGQINKDNDFFFFLADEYPIMNYHIGFQFNKKTHLSYLSANGAPEFVSSSNPEGDQILNLEVKNIPKYKDNLWTSPARQHPYITLTGFYNSKYNNALMGIKNDKQNNLSKLDKALNTFMEDDFNEVAHPIYTAPKETSKDYYRKKALKAAPLDSSMRVLYDAWRINIFSRFNGVDFDISEKKYDKAKSVYNTANMSRILTDMEIDHEILIVSSRNSNTLKNYFDEGDFDAMIKISNGDHPLYMCFDDMATHFNEIPAQYQGEEAISLKSKRKNAKNYTFIQGISKIPVSSPEQNILNEEFNVSLLADNMQKTKIERTIKQSGYMRHADQLRFLLLDDWYNKLAPMYKASNLNEWIIYQHTKSIAKNYKAAFDKARSEMKTKFIDEIKGDYDQEPQQFNNYKIINSSIESTTPVFEYTGTFVMDNFVKKAGSNYILEVGKLIGSDYKLDEEARNRKIDVYMPAARTLKYTINFTIPKGYKVNGAEELNSSKKNKTGHFTSTASVSNGVLVVNMERCYQNNFEKAANWPLLVELLDATYTFSTSKVLLEKE